MGDNSSASLDNVKSLLDGIKDKCPQFPDAPVKALDSLTSLNTVIGKIQSLCGPDCMRDVTMQSLLRQYEEALNNCKNAELNKYVAEENYVRNDKGDEAYDKLLIDRYTSKGKQELYKLNKRFMELNNDLNERIMLLGQQEIAINNINKVENNLSDENEMLSNKISKVNKDLYTYNRKAFYEQRKTDNLRIWRIVVQIIYWTLVVLWIGIVLLYLREFNPLNFTILIILIIFPFIATRIIISLITTYSVLNKYIVEALRVVTFLKF